MRSTIHTTAAVAFGAATLIAAGCGGSSGGHPAAVTTPKPASVAKSTIAMSTSQYLAAIQRIQRPLQEANSAYFHRCHRSVGAEAPP
jgi:hypothetical protein